MSKRLTDLLALSHVPRWTIVPHLRDQSVADHTLRVLLIAMDLSNRTGAELTMNGVLNILEHDASESRTGDIPAPAKDGLPDTDYVVPWLKPYETSVREDALLKVADLIEAYTFIERWGVGAHARNAAAGVYHKFKMTCPEEWLVQATQIIDDIAFDAGR